MDSEPGTGSIRIILDNQNEWKQNETIHAINVNKKGTTLRPRALFSVKGLEPEKLYAMSVHFVLFDKFCYISKNSVFEPYLEDLSAPNKTKYSFHPDLKSGKKWMASSFTFQNLRLVDRPSEDPNQISLHLNHRYELVLSVYEMPKNGNLKLATFCQFECTNFIATGTELDKQKCNIIRTIRGHVFENSASLSFRPYLRHRCSEQCKQFNPLPLPQLAPPINPFLGNSFNTNPSQPNLFIPQLAPPINPFLGNSFNTNFFPPRPLFPQLAPPFNPTLGNSFETNLIQQNTLLPQPAPPFNPFFGNCFNANFFQPTLPLPHFVSNPAFGSPLNPLSRDGSSLNLYHCYQPTPERAVQPSTNRPYHPFESSIQMMASQQQNEPSP